MTAELSWPAVCAAYDRASALHMQGRTGEAERAYEAVLQAAPDHVDALHGLGVLCLQGGKIDHAVEFLRRAVEAGGSTVVRNNLGVALCAAKRFAEAADVYRGVVATDPTAVSPRYNLGQILNQLHAFAEAVVVLQKAVDLSPNDGRLYHQLAVALAHCQRTDEAQACFENAAALALNSSELYCDWGAFLLKHQRAQHAAECYRHALSLSSNSPAAVCGLGEAFGKLGRHEDAVACFRRAVGLAPTFALAYFNCGTALTYLGRMSEAAQDFAKAAELEPDNPSYRSALIALKKTTVDNADLSALEALAGDPDRLDPQATMELQFTLAKAYDDIGDYARAFAALDKGCTAKRQLEPYDLQADLDRFRALTDAFSAEFLAAHAGAGEPSDVPVFIVGMPRSGTTLVEQIIASHPSVFGAGEQAILAGIINGGILGRNFPTAIDTLDDSAWRTVGRRYVETLRTFSMQALRITDKLPLNFQLIGLIRLAVPNARIVHVMRDPLDTCFSCRSRLFADPALGFTYDQTDLGRYYNGYRRIMDHWRAILPAGAMLQVQYETLVANFEGEARRIVAYCGLEWDDACLKFNETKRAVATASTLQVRRPLYKTSVGRAAHYAPWLEPLRAALAEETQL